MLISAQAVSFNFHRMCIYAQPFGQRADGPSAKPSPGDLDCS